MVRRRQEHIRAGKTRWVACTKLGRSMSRRRDHHNRETPQEAAVVFLAAEAALRPVAVAQVTVQEETLDGQEQDNQLTQCWLASLWRCSNWLPS